MNFIPGVTKYLDVVPAMRDTTQNTKPLSLTKARAIQKIRDYIVIPAHTYTYAQLQRTQAGALVFQYNVSMDYDFYFSVVSGRCTGGSLFIKYRVGATVYRYRIPIPSGIATTIQFGQASIQLLNWFGLNNNYSSQPIGRYCCFEFYLANVTPFFSVIGLTQQLLIKTSRFRNPITADDTGTSIGDSSNALEVTDLGLTLPVVLPSAQDNITWQSN